MNKSNAKLVGANLGFRKTWEACDASERAALVAGEDVVLERARKFNAGKSLNGYGPGWSRSECLKPVRL